MNEDKQNQVHFSARPAFGSYCVCDGCHHIGRVAILTIPNTKYRKTRNPCGIELTTEYSDTWLCGSCLEKLAKSIGARMIHRGDWSGSAMNWRCSNCHQQSRYTSDFCPNCGAYMLAPQDGYRPEIVLIDDLEVKRNG